MACLAAAIAAGATIAALGTSPGRMAGIPLLWVIAAVGGTIAGLSLIAHWDANRGRRPRRAEVVLEEIDDPGGQQPR